MNASYIVKCGSVNPARFSKSDHVKFSLGEHSWALELDVPKGKGEAFTEGHTYNIEADGLAVNVTPRPLNKGDKSVDFASWVNNLIAKVQATPDITNREAFQMLTDSLFTNIKLVGAVEVTDLKGNDVYIRNGGSTDDAPVGKLTTMTVSTAEPESQRQSKLSRWLPSECQQESRPQRVWQHGGPGPC